MKKRIYKSVSLLMAVLLTFCLVPAAVFAADEAADPVQAVIEQLEAIDSLEQMQAKRKNYAVKSKYFVYTEDPAVINAHETARAQYETYVAEMFAARLAAERAYDALSAEQQAQIDPALAAKLEDILEPVFIGDGIYSVTPRNDAYVYETVKNITSGGLTYYSSNYVTCAPEIPSVFILVDTSDGKTSWTPSGMYVDGESNYLLGYCCDVVTGLNYQYDYKRNNLENSTYYGDDAAEHIRAIVQNAFPFVSLEEAKAFYIESGLSEEFVNTLNHSDIVAATQMAIWAYANADEADIASNLSYGASYDINANRSNYQYPLLDYSNQYWTWWTTAQRGVSYDPRTEYRVNTLAYHLCNLDGVKAENDQILISDIQITRAELIPHSNDTYEVGMYITLNKGAKESDDLEINVISTDADGNITGRARQFVSDTSSYPLTVTAKYGDTIRVEVTGTQYVERGVYIYEPEGGRGASQTLVGVASGDTPVELVQEFTFSEDIVKGIRIYKTVEETGEPLSDITFDIYSVTIPEGETLNEKPTEEDIAKYQTAENLVGSVTTDVTGYASLALENGIYMIVEQHNEEKIVAPVDPFYISIPMPTEKENEDGTIVVEYSDIVSVYPKNTPFIPPPPPPIIPPPPDKVDGEFSIIKHDASDISAVLEGAQFKVYRPVTEITDATETFRVGNTNYMAEPVLIDGEPLVMTTGADGTAASPKLPCGTYFLVETAAPKGYQPLAEILSVTVWADEISVEKVNYIPNQRGAVLPETGGIGTPWLYIIGGILVVGAGVLLIVRRRMKNLDE